MKGYPRGEHGDRVGLQFALDKSIRGEGGGRVGEGQLQTGGDKGW